jgi:hypothetical protein
LLEAVRDEILILRPPLGFLCLSLEVRLFLGHFIGSPLSFLVFAPCDHYKKNAAFHRRPEIEVTLFPFDDFYPKIHWIVSDCLLSLVRLNAMAGHVADIRFVPIKLDLATIRARFLECTAFVGTHWSRASQPEILWYSNRESKKTR